MVHSQIPGRSSGLPGRPKDFLRDYQSEQLCARRREIYKDQREAPATQKLAVQRSKAHKLLLP